MEGSGNLWRTARKNSRMYNTSWKQQNLCMCLSIGITEAFSLFYCKRRGALTTHQNSCDRVQPWTGLARHFHWFSTPLYSFLLSIIRQGASGVKVNCGLPLEGDGSPPPRSRQNHSLSTLGSSDADSPFRGRKA